MFLEFKDIAKQKFVARKKRFFDDYPDIFTKMYEFTRAKTARALGYYPYFPKIEASDTTEVTIDGEQKIMLGSNNYLGLTNHPEVIEAGVKALRKYGAGLTGSRFLNGNIILHDQLEEQIAEFVGKEKSLVFSTGFGVNLGVIATIAGPSDLIFSDELNHASIVDGARFSRSRVVRFSHNNMDDLERRLSNADSEKARFIVSDGIFSMEGDIVDLPEMIRVAREYGCRVMIDDAHALGVIGPRGDGTAAHFGLTDQVDLIMGTFSKSLASVGGFIAGEEPVIDYLKHHTRTMIFTAALPPSNVATVSKALEILQREPERATQVKENAKYVRENLHSMGYDTGESTTPVVPVIIGEEMKTFSVWKELMKNGVYTNPVIPPAVPPRRSLLRTSYMATHTREQLDFCLEAFRKAGKKYKVI
ncbi:MAG TPA: aminotransferase class I/II-fold pyridoxal phosphate-dependent enzyme [bacterium]|nr:aminotransferase class I/II-fold pyridoxal phosphate-dependent enzyme [bacterium]